MVHPQSNKVVLAVDTENTTWNKGNAFDQRNFNVCISYATEGASGVCFSADDFRPIWDLADIIVGFNLKYDLHWLRRLGFSFEGKRFWCTQVCEFTLGRQSSPYPSLDESTSRYNLGAKSRDVEEYWKNGYNTHEIPKEVLEEYAQRDAELTYQLYLKQLPLVQPHQRVLMSLLMADTLVLQDMEWNGLNFDKEESLRKSKELETEISNIQASLGLYHSVPNFNWASGPHLSALLYGGTIVEQKRVPNGTFKTGARAGQTKFKLEEHFHRLPRRYNPIKGSELARANLWSVEENYLKKLKGKDGKLIEGILKIKELQKLNNTYYRGLPELHDEMHFEPGIIHGQFNQCVARTGRLSSSKPNLQNLSGDAQQIFTSRFNV